MSKFTSYADYINTSEHWKQLRIEKFNQVGRKCQCCGSERSIHVHHINYKNFTDCDISDLAVLCRPCHQLFHEALKVVLKEPSDYPTTGSTVSLIIWYRGSPQASRDSASRNARKAYRKEQKRKRHAYRETLNQIFTRCRRSQRRAEDIRECITSLQLLIGDTPTSAPDMAGLILNYDATA